MWEIKRTESKGHYLAAIVPEHPAADTRGRVYYHRVVMENHLGRLLHEGEVVHHKNGNVRDNHIENLEVLLRGEHASLHSPDADIVEVECAHCGVRFKKERRNVRGERVFCCRAHCVTFYSRKQGVKHGTYGRYRKGCRCEACRAANAAKKREARRKKRDVV